ncbi:MAG: TIGR04551 family protein [bacterium]
MTRWLMPLAGVLMMMALPGTAHAQMGRMPGAGGQMGKAGDDKPDKPKVAEQGKKPETKVEPKRVKTWGVKKPMQFFQLDGYFRVRSDVFINLHLGLQDTAVSKPSFRRPLQYYDTGSGGFCVGDEQSGQCDKNTITSTNMRLHLEPTLNVHSRVRVKMTLDIFDNFVLGSTPEGYSASGGVRPTYMPMNAFATTAEVPQAGRNSLYDVIQFKHAWGEVDLPFGRLMFGRMPSHWGMGILANSGTCSGYAKWTVTHTGDPMRCMDSDYGDIADRIMFVTKIPVIDLLVGFSWDFQASGVTSLNLQGEQVPLNSGQPYDLTPADDVQQWVAMLGRIDSPLKVRERLARGEVVFNYGTYWVFRQQKNFDYPESSVLVGNESALAGNLVKRDAFAMIPDLWLRLNWKKLQLEFEGVMVYGWITNLPEYQRMVKEGEKDLKILQFGWVFRGSYRFLKDSLVIKFEAGMASGDDQLEGAYGLTNYRNVAMFPQDREDRWNSLFRFDPNYRIDLIFFRELMGTIYNAGYIKPTIMYHILKELTARLDMIYSYAMEPVATPGNKPHYGVELDLDVEYRMPEEGFYVGIAYGVFFPLDALHRPGAIYGGTEDFFAKAKIAHTVQLRASIKF